MARLRRSGRAAEQVEEGRVDVQGGVDHRPATRAYRLWRLEHTHGTVSGARHQFLVVGVDIVRYIEAVRRRVVV